MRKGLAAMATALALLAGACSVLAPTDEEATRGLGARYGDASTSDADTSVADGAASDTDSDATIPPRICPGCAHACNAGICASCYLAGETCNRNDDCCAGPCTDGKCGAPAGACLAEGNDCRSSPDSCCAGLTCSAEQDDRCEQCAQNGRNCKADEDCCSVRCVDGSCQACGMSGSDCAGPRQCCSGTCTNRKCG